MQIRDAFIDFPTVHLVASSYKIRHNVPAIVVRYFAVVQWQNKPLEKEREGERKEREGEERESFCHFISHIAFISPYVYQEPWLFSLTTRHILPVIVDVRFLSITKLRLDVITTIGITFILLHSLDIKLKKECYNLFYFILYVCVYIYFCLN